MRLVVNIYRENRVRMEPSLYKTDVVETNWGIQKIEEYLKLSDGFHFSYNYGNHLSFLDFFCINVEPSVISEMISEIPRTNDTDIAKDKAWIFASMKINDNEFYTTIGTSGDFYVNPEECYIYERRRMECGASGFAELCIWAANHPLEMVFIGGVLYDLTKGFVGILIKILNRCLKKHHVSQESSEYVTSLAVARFYKNLSQVLNVRKEDIQITKLAKVYKDIIKVKVRTLSNERYAVECNRFGKIISVKKRRNNHA